MTVKATKTDGSEITVSIMKYQGSWVMYEDNRQLLNRIEVVDAGNYPEVLTRWEPRIDYDRSR